MADDERKPVRDAYDAEVVLFPVRGIARRAFGLVKMTFKIVDGNCKLLQADPLLHNFFDETLKPRLRPGCDFWLRKPATDVAILGSAYAPNGKPAREMQVGVQIGARQKRIAVFGDRRIEWKNGAPSISAPERFEEIPVTYENAYGGIDWRVPVSENDPHCQNAAWEVDWPGLYPRNPFGKGYLVYSEPLADAVMPNLEDPSDLLAANRLIVGDPQLWYRQPLPWCFDWVRPVTWPRCLFFAVGDADAWYPGPEDEQMPEVKRGFLPRDYRAKLKANAEEGILPEFFQEAAYGLVLGNLKGNEPVLIQGMHPEQSVLSFNLPGMIPAIELEVDGDRTPLKPRLHSVICEPAEEKVALVWAADDDLPRKFIPGVHKYIPVGIRVNGDEPVFFEAPPTAKEQIRDAKAAQENKPDETPGH
jgi:hypothetical protein